MLYEVITEQLNNDLEKKNSVIKLQNTVIRLLDDTKKTIETSLKDEIAAREIELVKMQDTLKVVFIDKILFDSGSIDINEKGKKLLLVVAESVRSHKDQKVLVEGHTDNRPLGSTLKERFPSNWELSTRITSYNVCYTKLLRQVLRSSKEWSKKPMPV